MLMLIIKTLIMLLSILGYQLYISRKGIHPAFAPVLTTAGISIAMFFAGIFNIMPLVAWFIFLAGLFFGVSEFKQMSPPPRKISCELPPLFYFVIAYILLALRVREALPTHYDNFSHWLLIIEEMVRTDRLPSFQSDMIFFQSYPTGSAGFIYFVCKILGNSEGFILLGQGILLISCLTGFWAFVKKSTPFATLLIVLATVYLLSANNSITDLTVDSLLSLAGISAFATILYYKDDILKCTLCSCLIGSFLVLLKNSGIFFVAIHIILLAVLWLSNAKKCQKRLCSREILLPLGLSIFAPASIAYLWNRHVDYAFAGGNYAKHSMSPEYYSYILESQSWEDFRTICATFLRRATAFGPETIVLLILLGAFACFALLARREKGHRAALRFYLSWSFFAYITYLVGLLGMYLVSMPYYEASILGSYDRYLATITMYMVGIAVIFILGHLEHPFPGKRSLCGIFMICLLIGTVWGQLGYLFYRSGSKHYSAETRVELQRVKEIYELPAGDSYYVITTDESDYCYFLARYEFWAPDVAYCFAPKPEDIPTIFKEYNYLIVLNQTEATLDFLEAAGLPAGEKAYDLSQYR